jgi:hypothetical protein
VPNDPPPMTSHPHQLGGLLRYKDDERINSPRHLDIGVGTGKIDSLRGHDIGR